MELKGRTALITGSCGRGMGRSTALRLAREGANIVLNYGTHRRGPEMQASTRAIAEAVAELGSRAIVQEADTRDEQQIKAMVEAACKEFGQVDILVNNAGGDFVCRDYTKLDLAQWKDVLAVEIDGAFLTMKYTVPGMRTRRWGRAVHIGLEGVFRHPGAPAPGYCLGKAARSWMTEAFGPREIKNGVTMNCIEPGLTPGLSLEDAVCAARGEHLNSEITALHPSSDEVMRTWRGPWAERPGPVCHDVAELVAFLCSETARFVSGQVISLPHFPERILRAGEHR